MDENGKIIRDKKNNPIIIHNVSLDEPTPDCISTLERISLEYNLENEVLNKNKSEFVSKKTREYLNKLTKLQRKVAELIMDGYSSNEG